MLASSDLVAVKMESRVGHPITAIKSLEESKEEKQHSATWAVTKMLAELCPMEPFAFVILNASVTYLITMNKKLV